jgi:hypothetical protein
VASFFKRIQQLYDQVQVTRGCEIGALTRKAFALEGLSNGAYHEIFKPFVQKVHLKTGLVKLATSTLDDIQSAAADVLVSSKYYTDHLIMAGRFPTVKARVATEPTPPPPPTGNKPSNDPMLESIIQNMRQGRWLGPDQAGWIQTQHKCVQCWTNTHTTEACNWLKEKWHITAKSDTGPPSRPPPSGPREGNGRQVTDGKPEGNAQEAKEVANAAKTATGELPTDRSCGEGVPERLNRSGSESDSEPDNSDNAFATRNTVHTTGADLLAAMSQMAERSAEDTRRSALLKSKPIAQKTVARMAKSDKHWIQPHTTPVCERTNTWTKGMLETD